MNSKKLSVEMNKILGVEQGVNAVQFTVYYEDNTEPTGQQLLEAVSEAIIMYWDNTPIEEMDARDYDA